MDKRHQDSAGRGQSSRRCLKCGRPVSRDRWLCQPCRQQNAELATEAEGVSNLYDDGGER